MARCCGQNAGTLVQAADHVTVTGTGSSQDPYVISGDVDLEVIANATFALGLGGAGSAASPWVLTLNYASSAKLDDIPDVNAAAPTNGQVLGWDSTTSKWTPRAATTASSGSVLHDSSMTGDGSSGAPLGIAEDSNGYLQTGTGGLGLSDEGKNSLIRHFGNDLARSADTVTPDLNAVTMLDDNPGVQDYWNGVDWVPVTNGVARDFSGEFMALSGSYDGGPVTMMTRQVAATTGADGSFDLLDSSDLVGAAGVLAVVFQETGSIPFKAVAFDDTDTVSAIAYRLDDGTPYTTQVVTGIVIAYVY